MTDWSVVTRDLLRFGRAHIVLGHAAGMQTMGAETVTLQTQSARLDMLLRTCSKMATSVQDSAASSIDQSVLLFSSCCLSASAAYNAFIYWDFIEGNHGGGLVILPCIGTIAALHDLDRIWRDWDVDRAIRLCN